MEEVDRLRVAAVLAADAELEVGPGAPALLDGDLHQPADAVDVDGLERRDREDALVEVGGEERGLDVVPGEAPRGLGQVVGAEGEELGGLGDPVRGQRGARQLDHRADRDRQLDAGPRRTSRRICVALVADQVQLHHRPDQRHHDLHLRVLALALQLRRRPRRWPGPAGRTGRGRRARAGRRADPASGCSRAAARPPRAAARPSGRRCRPPRRRRP